MQKIDPWKRLVLDTKEMKKVYPDKIYLGFI